VALPSSHARFKLISKPTVKAFKIEISPLHLKKKQFNGVTNCYLRCDVESHCIIRLLGKYWIAPFVDRFMLGKVIKSSFDPVTFLSPTFEDINSNQW